MRISRTLEAIKRRAGRELDCFLFLRPFIGTTHKSILALVAETILLRASCDKYEDKALAQFKGGQRQAGS